MAEWIAFSIFTFLLRSFSRGHGGRGGEVTKEACDTQIEHESYFRLWLFHFAPDAALTATTV